MACLGPADRSPEGLELPQVVPEIDPQVSGLVVDGLAADSLAGAGHIAVAEVEAEDLGGETCQSMYIDI